MVLQRISNKIIAGRRVVLRQLRNGAIVRQATQRQIRVLGIRTRLINHTRFRHQGESVYFTVRRALWCQGPRRRTIHLLFTTRIRKLRRLIVRTSVRPQAIFRQQRNMTMVGVRVGTNATRRMRVQQRI